MTDTAVPAEAPAGEAVICRGALSLIELVFASEGCLCHSGSRAAAGGVADTDFICRSRWDLRAWLRSSPAPQPGGARSLCSGSSPVEVGGGVAAARFPSLQGSGVSLKPPFPAVGWGVVVSFRLDCGWFSLTLWVLHYTSSAKHGHVQLSHQSATD